MVMTEDGGSGQQAGERIARRYPFGLAIFIFLLAFWLSFTNSLVGFPDGHLTDLDEAEQPLIAVFNWISIVIGLWLIVLGLAAHGLKVRKPYLYTLLLYALIIVVTLLIDTYFHGTLMDGRGG